jgi:prophage regulatory protein
MPLPRMLRLRAVLDRTALPKSTVYQKIKEGEFPKPVPLGPKSVAWVESEIEDWLLERIRRRDQSPDRRTTG